MASIEQFKENISVGYSFKGESILLGGTILDGNPVPNIEVRAPLSMFNRHGLIAGATGTGKTKTLQGIAEGLSEAGVPVLLMDIKGDLSGLAMPGKPHPKITQRHEIIGQPWNASKFPVELLSISNEKGVRMRATISEFGPTLLSKILGLNEAQSGVVAIAFQYCDDRHLPLLDIKDFRMVLQYISGEGKAEVQRKYGLISTSSIGAVLRRLLELEQQDADLFFGELSTDVQDLIRINEEGKGYINILRLGDMQSRPKLFSTFMLCLLAEIYDKFPERGDAERPELVIFIDEAHLMFDQASKALLNQLETIVKLIRSKGVGVFFCTQVPSDVPEEILSQLGMKVQHALRAFTAKDRKSIKQVAENYPLTAFYDTDRVLTQMGLGEALITLLNEKGVPTPLVHCLLKAPASRMGVLSDSEMNELVSKSELFSKYNEEIDRESAFEVLSKKIERLSQEDPKKDVSKPKQGRAQDSTFEKVLKSPMARDIVKELTRGLLGILGVKTTSRSRRK